MESNRNLSSIISRIRDEGPPGAEKVSTPDTRATVTPAPAIESLHRPPAVRTGRRAMRWLLLVVVIPLALVAGLVIFAANHTGYRDEGGFAGLASDVRGWFAAAPERDEGAALPDGNRVSGPDANADLLDELRLQQADLDSRVNELARTVATLTEALGRNRTDTDTGIAVLRAERQAAVGALESRMADLQRQLSGLTSESAVRPKQTETATQPHGQDVTKQASGGEEWVVNVASSSREQAMTELAAKLRDQGVNVERQTLTVDGNLMYRLRVPGFSTSAEAQQYAQELDRNRVLRGAWISRR